MSSWLDEGVQRDDAPVEVVAEPPDVGEHHQGGQAGLRGLRRLELLGDFLVVGAGCDQVDLDPGILGLEVRDHVLFHVLGLARVVGPEVDGRGRLDAVKIQGRLAGTRAGSGGGAAAGAERGGAGPIRPGKGRACGRVPASVVSVPWVVPFVCAGAGCGAARRSGWMRWEESFWLEGTADGGWPGAQPVTLPWVRPATM